MKLKLATFGAVAAAVIWLNTALATPNYGAVTQITDVVEENALSYCEDALPEQEAWLQCVNYYVGNSANTWLGIAYSFSAEADYCTQHLIYPCDITFAGLTMTAIDWRDTAFQIVEDLVAYMSS